MRLDLVSLRYFVAIANQKSFRKAASELHISQPALSRRVQMLEDALGVPLLMRHGRGVTPTAAGEILRKRAEAILRLESEIHTDVRATSTTPAGHVRIGTPPSLAKLLLPDIVNRYLRDYPKVTWSVSEGFSDELQRDLLEDKIDIAIMTQGADHPDLLYQPLYSEQLCLIFRSDIELFTNAPFPVDDLSTLPIITSPVILDLINRQASKRCISTVSLGSISPGEGLIWGARAYFVGQRALFWKQIEEGTFRALEIEGMVLPRCLATRVDRPLSLAAGMTVNEIQQGIEKIIRWPVSPFLPPQSLDKP